MMKRICVVIALVMLLGLDRSSSSQGKTAWVANIGETQVLPTGLQVAVYYNNSVSKVVENYVFSGANDIATDLNNTVFAKLTSLNAINGFTPPSGAFVPTDPNGGTDPNIAPLRDAIKNMNHAKNAVALGVIDTSAKEYQDALTALKALYQPQYLNLF